MSLLKSGPPQFHIPLSSTYQIHTNGPPLFSHQNTSVPHQMPSLAHRKPLVSTPKTPQLHAPLSSTPKTPQFHTKTLQFHPSVPHIPEWYSSESRCENCIILYYFIKILLKVFATMAEKNLKLILEF